MTLPRRVARVDPSLRATVASRRPLRYRDGADPALDRPAHLRAGSSLTRIGDRLILVQDDANFVAIVDPQTGLADAITLPAGKHGLRQFDDARGNKKFKLDLEACCGVSTPDGPALIAMGSGSKKRRRQMAIITGWDQTTPHVSLVDADALYLALEDAADFAGSDMNIEGALALPGVLRLFGRGNGAPRKGRLPLNATCDVSLAALLEYLASPEVAPVPTPTSIVQYDLGTLDGLPLGFTDAALRDGSVLYTATSENSSNASDDGWVAGSVLGVIPAAGHPRYATLQDARGDLLREKVEGVAPDLQSPSRVYVVIDCDDATRPSELCEVALEGEWG